MTNLLSLTLFTALTAATAGPLAAQRPTRGAQVPERSEQRIAHHDRADRPGAEDRATRHERVRARRGARARSSEAVRRNGERRAQGQPCTKDHSGDVGGVRRGPARERGAVARGADRSASRAERHAGRSMEGARGRRGSPNAFPMTGGPEAEVQAGGRGQGGEAKKKKGEKRGKQGKRGQQKRGQKPPEPAPTPKPGPDPLN